MIRLAVTLALLITLIPAAKPSLAERHPRPGVRANASARGGSPHNIARTHAATRRAPSPYWRLERRYAALHRTNGRLGREVRRLRRAQRLMTVTHRRQLRTLASSSSLGGSALERDFLCIYSGENGGYGWGAETGNGYHGGLQMDQEFERTYGPEFVRAWGHASNWPSSVQIAVAIKAYLSGRGFYPWPTTARNCGLIG